MKRCLILANTFKADSKKLSEELVVFLDKKNVNTKVFFYNGEEDCSELKLDFSGYDFVITLGGDGTVLYACRNCAPYSIPVFSINLGEFGFLASISKKNWKIELENYLSEKICLSKRNLLHCEVIREGKSVFKSLCMNDCVISSSESSRIINLNVAYNRALLGPFKTSGLIVSTPTGSTAYSAAAGGPIIDISLSAMVLTPISSFSLSARPLVFGSDGEIVITVLDSRCSVVACVDGHVNFNLKKDDVIIIQVPECTATLLGASQEKFYSALQSKLNWSGGPRA